VVPKGYRPPPARTSWQGAAELLAGDPDQDKLEVVNVELVQD
jgi:hypothetical protein